MKISPQNDIIKKICDFDADVRRKGMTLRNNSLSKDFTKGNIATQLLLFSLPFMASNALQVLYSTIDMIIVGKYVGTAGLSAVSAASTENHPEALQGCQSVRFLFLILMP